MTKNKQIKAKQNTTTVGLSPYSRRFTERETVSLMSFYCEGAGP